MYHFMFFKTHGKNQRNNGKLIDYLIQATYVIIIIDFFWFSFFLPLSLLLSIPEVQHHLLLQEETQHRQCSDNNGGQGP